MLKILDCLFGAIVGFCTIISVIASFMYVLQLLIDEPLSHSIALDEEDKRKGYLGIVFFIVFFFVLGWINIYS